MELRAAWEDQAEAWAAWARTPDFDYVFWRFNLPCFLEILPQSPRLTIDIGCGEGRLARALTERGQLVIGIDGSPTLAALAATHETPQVVAIADAAALPMRDAVADLAIAFMVLQDVDDLEHAIAEAARVVATGGHLCLAIVHPIASAGEFVDADDDESAFVVQRLYSQPARLVESIERDGLSMVFHSEHRPLDAYCAALERSGFVIEALREPWPDDDMLRDYPGLRRQQRVPWFLHLRARRETIG